MSVSIFQDDKIILGLQNKDPQAFGLFYDQYVEKIYQFIYFKVFDATTSQDLTSIVFLKIWEYILNNKQGQPIRNIKAFAYTVSKNVVMDFYRNQYKKSGEIKFDENIDEIDNLPFSQSYQPAGDLFKSSSFESLQAIQDSLKILKDEYREVIVLRYIDNISIADMARILNKSKVGVRVTIHRAINALRRIINSSQKNI